jgi:hypothetical protein
VNSKILLLITLMPALANGADLQGAARAPRQLRMGEMGAVGEMGEHARLNCCDLIAMEYERTDLLGKVFVCSSAIGVTYMATAMAAVECPVIVAGAAVVGMAYGQKVVADATKLKLENVALRLKIADMVTARIQAEDAPRAHDLRQENYDRAKVLFAPVLSHLKKDI